MKRTAAALIILASCACASTPQRRIRSRAAQFASYPPDIQAKIRAGRVEIGFTPDMVLMAMGKPDEKFMDTSGKAPAEVWSYIQSSPSPATSISSGMNNATGNGPEERPDYGDDRRFADQIRVFFQAGLVSDVRDFRGP